MDTARFAPGRLIPAALTIISTPIFARVLGAEEYGVLAIATTATLLGAAVLFGWSEIVAVRDLVDAKQSIEQLISVGSVFLIVAAVVGALATLAAGLFTDELLLVGAVALATIAWGATTFWSGAMRGRSDAGGFVAVTGIASAGRALLGVPAVLAGLGPAGVIASWAAGGALACSYAIRRARVRVSGARPARPSREFLEFAIPAAVVTSCFLALSLCDRLIIAAFRPESEVGTYSLGYAIVEQSMVLGFSVMQASGFPRLLSVFDEHGSEAGTTALASKLTIAVTAIGFIALPLALFGDHVITLFGGDEFTVGTDGFMPAVVIGVILLGVGQYLSIPLQHRRDTRVWARSLGVAAAVNILANLALIPEFGLLGAGVATALGYLVLVALCARASAAIGVRPLGSVDWVPAIVATSAGALAGLAGAAAGSWVAGAAAAMLAYAACVFALRKRIDWSDA